MDLGRRVGEPSAPGENIPRETMVWARAEVVRAGWLQACAGGGTDRTRRGVGWS